MFVWRFCRVVAAETYDTTWKLVEVVEYQYHSAQDYFKTQKTKRGLKKNMKNAPSYSEWKKHAQEYDKLQESGLWKETNESNLYDWHYIEHITDILRDSREKGDYMAVIHTIRSNATRNLGNILDSQLYSGSYVGTKHVIERFHNEMTACLDYIVSLPHSKLPKSKKLEFFAETRQAFGKTALIFSGGGGMGKYHLGVIKCLYEEGLLPRVIAGSSIGSVFACFLGTKTPEELEDIFVPERMDFSAYNKRQKFSLLKNLKSLIKYGYLIDPAIGRDYMRGNIGDITFQEAYDKTGFILNITTTGQGPYDSCKLLNYLTAPNVVIWSAVCASCAVPYIFGPMELYCKDEYGQIKLYMPEDKKFVDGSISADVPTQYLSEMFNVNCFIVSQVNPWMVPFLKHSEHLRHSPFTFLHRVFEIIKDLIGSEIQHRFNQLTRIGIFPKAIARYFNLITQTYCGHVTIFPKPTLYDFLTLVNDPSPEAMRQGLEGRKSVYPKINRISAILEVEKSIEKNYQLIKTAIEKKISLDEVEELEKSEDFIDRETIFTTDIDEEFESRKLSSPFQVPRSFSSELLKSVTRSLSISIPNNNIPVTE